MKTKIVYVVVSTDDDIYLEQTWASAYSLRLYTPQAHIIILTDEETNENIMNSERKGILSVVDEIITVKIEGAYNNMEKSRWLKTNMRALISGDFLFIDSDTVICGDLSEADDFDCSVGVTYDYNSPIDKIPNTAATDVRKRVRKIFGQQIKEETNYYNSGVMYVKDDSTAREFFRQWHKNWEISRAKGTPTDQTALVKTCDDLGDLYDIGGIWNCQVLYTIKYFYDAKILHFFHTSYGRPTFSPFFEKEIYLDIKKARGITPGVDDLIKNCKRRLDSPTITICHEDVALWASVPYRYLHWVYINNKALYKITVFICRVLNKVLGVWRDGPKTKCGRTEVTWERVQNEAIVSSAVENKGER
ncbi:MAG: hypothetical protein LUE21_09100 [Oscillospiraceae bacterium]|nr:hypothetical protein [Oscillospiraceae bacterium]